MWQKQRSGVNRHLFGVHFIDPQNGWVVGQGGVILHTRSGGQKWDVQAELGEIWLSGVYFTDYLERVGLLGLMDWFSTQPTAGAYGNVKKATWKVS